MTPDERVALEKRLVKLGKMTREVEKAAAKFQMMKTPDKLRVRPEFVRRLDGGAAAGDPSDRGLPARTERPPATQLPAPRGSALAVYLTALFVAQSRRPGQRPGNTLPLDAREKDRASWVDLIATPAERSGTVTATGVGDKKLRAFQSALKRLASPELLLVELPNAGARSKTYEGFLLLREGGRPRDGSDNEPYVVPDPNDPALLQLPAGLFLNGWIHVLEDRELTFLLMLASMRAQFPGQKVFIPGQTRLLEFGLGRDAYQSHHLLDRLGLIDVEEAENRYMSGRVEDYDPNTTPKVHRFELRDDGFEQPALDTIIKTINVRLDPASHRDSSD